MSYPTAIPSYGDTTGNQTLATAGGIGLSGILDLYGVDITAIATKVGSGASTPTANTFLMGNGVGTSVWSSQPVLIDNQKLYFGTSSDGAIYYDGTNLVIDAREVGSGVLYVKTPINIEGSNGNMVLSANTDGGEYNVGVSVSGTLAFYGSSSATLNVKLLDGTLYTDTIGETTAANGVTIDGLNVKDGKLNTADSVVTSNYTDGSILPEHLVTANGTSWAWQSFVPSWTNLSPGTGGGMINQGYYTIIGKTVHARVQMYFGSSGNSMGSNPYLAWPVAASSTMAARTYVGLALYKDANGGQYTGYLWKDTADDRMQLLIDNVSATYPTISGLAATLPFTWVATDEIVLSFSYEAA